VRSTQSGANLKGAVMSSNTHKSGDELIQVNGEMGSYSNRDYMYAFLSTDEMSAGMWSNSEHEGRVVAAPVKGGSQNTRIYATSEERDGYKTMGLASAEWYYHRNVTDSKGVEYTVTETEMPQSKIVITGDMNEDAQIDWQDGAIAFRDIMNNPYKSEEVPELVAWRIAMNFGGQAQNPFLTTLDNVKRVAQHTDGLGQSVLLKGYGSEGHDSGHPDYANIGERIGGAEDMNTLMEKGAEYGARFGIHVNASEMYPEAKAFNEEMVRRNSSGALSYGWNWLDQGIGIDGIYDLASGAREARFDELKEKVGDNMDFIYLDVWGNLTSGSAEDSWETRKMSKMITDNGWRMTTEWGSGNEYDSTFQHWATDLTYGGYDSKGENSEVMRFLRNHQKDSWVGDYPSYGGVANAPLLGGYNMKDFEGWQGRNDYDAYITNLYTHDLMTKFLQHYKVVKWEDGEPVQMTDNGETYTWIPEKQITLKADPKKSSAETDTVVVTRGSTDPSDAAYRDRTVTLNGIVISQGAVTRGDNASSKGTESYLIPWNWDSQTGDEVASEQEKLYHWNTQGGTATWELQDSWKNLSDVKVYKLTDLGKTEEQTVPVVDGTITLTAEAETPYVVCKGDEVNLEITWSEGMHIVDAGFNSGNDGLNEYWEKSGDGTAEIAKSQYSNPMMKLDGEVSMTQELTELTPGQKYAVYVGVDNRSEAKAYMTVKAGDEVLDSNYTEESIAKNYVQAYTHSNSSATVDGSSYFQNMYIFFTAPESGTVTLTLSRDAGEGSTYFDDIRVVESEMDVVKKDEDGNVVGMEQDFENNAQGIYPFVIGAIEGVEDNRTHLSELHDPYTQAGWDVKKMDDVLDGNWSVKTNGLVQRNALVYQTIPQNFRFEPGRTYKVSFDYQAGSDGTYGVTIGDGEFEGGTSLEALDMAMGADQDGHYETTITGSASGQTWFGIYSTGTAPDLQGTSGSAANFGGYQDFVLDNLKIELVDEEVTADSLQTLIDEAESSYEKSDYLDADWAVFQNALTYAKVALNKDKQNQKEIEDAYYALKAAMMTLDTASGTEADDKYDITSDKYTVEAGSAQPQSGNEGPVEFAQDGNGSTHWHTSWSADVVEADGSGDGWYQFNFSEPMTVNGMRYLPRIGAANANGKIVKADILVSKDNGTSWETAAKDAEFSTTTMWQKVNFDAVEGVTNVRIVATETAGQSAAESNKYVSAAELRVLQPVEDEPETVDKSALEAAVSEAESLDSGDYTEETWSVVEEKLAEAKEVLEKEDATAYDIALALANLKDAVADLEESENPEPGEEISTAVLEYVIELAGSVNTDGVIDTVKENFEKALQNAQDILAKVQSGDASVTQSQVDDAWRNLIKAMQYMEFKAANKEDLAKVIALAEEMNSNLDKYLEDGKAAFTSALEEAKAVYENEIATQEEVNSAWQNLLNAIANMMLKPDKGLLEDLIAQAEGLNEADYEAQSFAAMRTALVAAKEVLADENATEEEISTSVAALEDALAKLTPVSTGGDQSGSGNGSQDQTGGTSDKDNTSSAGNTSSSKTSGTNAAKTGDTANALPIAATAAAAALAAGAAVVLIKKKEDN
ncbi:MAG: endo-alpha-N-acetylgalactosaminidase family protein, partial [Mediterraneibacter sp.]